MRESERERAWENAEVYQIKKKLSLISWKTIAALSLIYRIELMNLLIGEKAL